MECEVKKKIQECVYRAGVKVEWALSTYFRSMRCC